MRRTTTARLSLAVAGLALAGLVLPAAAASVPTALVITDEKGDALVGDADDIVSLTYTTTGTTTTKKVGKKTVKAYTPKALVMTLVTAGDIDTSGGTQYDVEGSTSGCGSFFLYVAPGSALETLASACADDDTVTFEGSSFAVQGKTITFTVPLGSVPGITAGGSIAGLNGYTGSVDPVSGELGPVVIGGTLANDDAPSDATYKIG